MYLPDSAKQKELPEWIHFWYSDASFSCQARIIVLATVIIWVWETVKALKCERIIYEPFSAQKLANLCYTWHFKVRNLGDLNNESGYVEWWFNDAQKNRENKKSLTCKLNTCTLDHTHKQTPHQHTHTPHTHIHTLYIVTC